eukprot:TRINITY_DN9220_c0_g1_i1.p1 TRINITY_DN9220_c0_g1~~TRINITY_DN9220_c0_g1_i1.p1  ORF type:complete len:1199 (-),score=229.39 TRINITY_DN9220_c0_g1_i1:96-3692(-)
MILQILLVAVQLQKAGAAWSYSSPVHMATSDMWGRKVTTGDFNNDGLIDILNADTGGYNDLYLQSSSSPGSFSAGISISNSGYPNGVIHADLNNDGNLDFATANHNTNGWAYFLGDGTGGFAPRVFASSCAGPNSLVHADVDNDGTKDIVVSCSGGGHPGSGKIKVFKAQIVGTSVSFTPRSDYGSYTGFNTIRAGDLNGDGNMDLAIFAGNGGTGVTVLYGSGDGTTWSPTTLSTDRNYNGVLIDMDGDGDLDIVSQASSSLYVVINNGASFSSAVSTNSPLATDGNSAYLLDLATADLNQDGNPDMIAGDSDGDICYFLGNGGTSFSSKACVLAGTGTADHSWVYGVAADDVTGDGVPDMIGTVRYENKVAVLASTGVTALPAPVSVDCVGHWGPGYGACSATCGSGGMQSRTFTITTPAAGTGNTCTSAAGATESQQCNTDVNCPVDCALSNWSEWACSVTCGPGTMTRTRTVEQSPQYGGLACDPTVETGDCGSETCVATVTFNLAPGECGQLELTGAFDEDGDNPAPVPEPVASPVPIPVEDRTAVDTSGVTVVASASHSNGPVANILVATTAGFWNADSGSFWWVAFDLGAPYQLTGLTYLPYHGYESPRNFNVQTSDAIDGAWTTVASFVGTSDEVEQSFDFVATTQFVRIYISTSQNGAGPTIYWMKFFGDPAPVDECEGLTSTSGDLECTHITMNTCDGTGKTCVMSTSGHCWKAVDGSCEKSCAVSEPNSGIAGSAGFLTGLTFPEIQSTRQDCINRCLAEADCGAFHYYDAGDEYHTHCYLHLNPTGSAVITTETDSRQRVAGLCGLPVSCRGEWSDYGSCSVTCGAGSSTRTFSVSTAAVNGGEACPAADGETESQECSEDECAERLVAADVCFDGQTYGAFSVVETGTVTAVRLVHKSGGITCTGLNPRFPWGCENNAAENLMVVMTGPSSNAPVVPTAGTAGYTAMSTNYYYLAGYTRASSELVFTGPELTVARSEEYRLWYMEGLNHPQHATNNEGTSCVDVYFTYSPDMIAAQSCAGAGNDGQPFLEACGDTYCYEGRSAKTAESFSTCETCWDEWCSKHPASVWCIGGSARSNCVNPDAPVESPVELPSSEPPTAVTTYEWLKSPDSNVENASVIAGANGSVYTPSTNDIGSFIFFRVTSSSGAVTTVKAIYLDAAYGCNGDVAGRSFRRHQRSLSASLRG